MHAGRLNVIYTFASLKINRVSETSSLKRNISSDEAAIQRDRKRTNIFRGLEQPILAFLCRIMPSWVSPDMLTVVGLIGSLGVSLGFYMAKDDHRYLFISIIAFAVQWFGDSLDGRIAVYRNAARKWYGFSLDLSVDWVSTALMGVGFYFFLDDRYKILSFVFVCSYAWTMLLAIIKFKLTDEYNIDSGLFGPTEFRLAICSALFTEIVFPGSLLVFALVVVGVVSIINFVELGKVLKLGNERDAKERNAAKH